jgi:hypothetical protein
VAFAEATSSFHQRLLFERVMERYVPREKRRDLKPPGWLRLDVTERFPRIVVTGPEETHGPVFGPFRDRRAADKARTVLHKLWPLRPCDYVFEPDPELPLGLGCLYAQVRSCIAPCLARVREDAYRGLAREVGEVLAGRAPRPEELLPVLPHFVSEAGARGLVAVSNPKGVELYPVAAGAVLEEGALSLPLAEAGLEARGLESALPELRFDPPPGARDDRPWLLAWIVGQKRGGGYLVVREGEPADAFATRVREVLS